MKKLLLLTCALLLLVAGVAFVASCSSDDNVDEKVQVSCELGNDSLPDWLKEKITLYEREALPLEVYQCVWNRKRIIHFYTPLSSNLLNCYFYEDGTIMSSSEVKKVIQYLKSWQLIYYNDILPLSNEHTNVR